MASIVSAGGAVTLVGQASQTTTVSSTGLTLGSVNTGGGALNVNASLSGTSITGYALSFMSASTVSTAGGAITFNAGAPSTNGIAIYGNNSTLDSAGGN
ncbi:hypothetical protein, partial [Caballeronia sp. AAUFL_F1_KS47]|uniref:hypothetical protein n=1 Tax=Caballeronia sp. AAUFL_F1_KS47 TaxID=2921771 RepID=UPI00202848AD